jgi:hypothetical protein
MINGNASRLEQSFSTAGTNSIELIKNDKDPDVHNGMI